MAAAEVSEPSWWRTLTKSVQNHLKSLVAGREEANEELIQTVVVEGGIKETDAEEFLAWYFATEGKKASDGDDDVIIEDHEEDAKEEEKKEKEEENYNDEEKYDELANLPKEHKLRLDPDLRESVVITKANNRHVIIEGKHGNGIDVGSGILAEFTGENNIKRYCVICPGFCVTYRDEKKQLVTTETIRLRMPKVKTYNKRNKSAREGKKDLRFEYFMVTDKDVVLYPYYSHFGSSCQTCFNFAIIKLPPKVNRFIHKNCDFTAYPFSKDIEKVCKRVQIFKEEKGCRIDLTGFPGVDEKDKSYEIFTHRITDMTDMEFSMDSEDHGTIYYGNQCTQGQAGAGVYLTYDGVTYLAGMQVEVDRNEQEEYGCGCLMTTAIMDWIEGQVFDGMFKKKPSKFNIGSFVELEGLTSATGKLLNGKRGTIGTKSESNRWGIKLTDGREVAIREANLKLIDNLDPKVLNKVFSERPMEEPKNEDGTPKATPAPVDPDKLSENQKRWLNDMMQRQARGML